MKRTSIQTVILGEEYDEALFAVVKQVLSSEGATLINKSWGVVGSQEISTWRVKIGGQKLTIEAETYMGLSISGPAGLVSQIALTVAEQATA